MSTPVKLPAAVIPITRIASILTTVQSSVTIVLCSIAMSSYLTCNFVKLIRDPTDLFATIIQHYYFLEDSCHDNIPMNRATFHIEGTISPQVLFIWIAILLSFSIVWFIVSIVLGVFVCHETLRDVNVVIYFWCVATLAVTVTDICMGVHFGISYGNITKEMVDKEFDAMQYARDLLRLGTIMLMTVSLRGFILIIINIAMAITLFTYTFKINKIIIEEEQSIHHRDPINGFASGNQNAIDRVDNEDRIANWPYNSYERGSQYRSSDHSNSWRQGRDVGLSSMAPVPFSYLEEPRPARQRSSSPISPAHAPALASAPAPAPSTSWQRRPPHWEQTPAVPAPDYSPQQGRRLKSALKNTYI